MINGGNQVECSALEFIRKAVQAQVFVENNFLNGCGELWEGERDLEAVLLKGER
jgi:hypothetical protein